MASVSIIIATRNCFEKIDALMLSLFRQSVQDIEIVCVDDASNDGTLNLLRHYAGFDKRVQVISSKKEHGLLECCHLGLKKTTAPYVMFVNGTQHLLFVQAFLERLINSAKQNNSDVVYTPVIFVDAVMFTPYQLCLCPKQFFDKTVGTSVFKATDVPGNLMFNFYLSPYLKLYRTDFVKDADFTAYDEPFFLNELFRADRISADLDFLCYRQIQQCEFERPQIFDEQLANRRILEKYGTWDTYKDFYVLHKMHRALLALQNAHQKNKSAMFEKLKAEFKNEDFKQYDFNVLRQSNLYWLMQSIDTMSLENLIVEKTDAA